MVIGSIIDDPWSFVLALRRVALKEIPFLGREKNEVIDLYVVKRILVF